LELHTNLTLVQTRLLNILQTQLGEAERRDVRQRGVQKQWNEFTVSLEESLDLLSVNITNLMRELFTGLLTLQSFTRDSARHVGGELQSLELDVLHVRGQLLGIHDDIDALGSHGVLKMDEMNEMTLQQLSKVLFCFCTYIDTTYA
jgi:hypothetical protein